MFQLLLVCTIYISIIKNYELMKNEWELHNIAQNGLIQIFFVIIKL